MQSPQRSLYYWQHYMFFKNKFLLAASLLIIFQQTTLAVSTFFIATAGKFAGVNDINNSLFYISLFFISALIAYITSSISEILINKLINTSWKNYTLSCFDQVKFDQGYSSSENKTEFINWMTTEAMVTFKGVQLKVCHSPSPCSLPVRIPITIGPERS